MKKSILTSLALVLLAFAANAQGSTTAQHKVKVIASPVLDISMTSPDDVEFAFDTPEKYEAGITKNAATQLKVKSTKSWTVKASGAAENFTSTSGDNNTELAVGDLEIGSTVITTPAVPAVLDPVTSAIITPEVPAVYGPATYADLTTTPGTTVKTGSKGGNSKSGNTFSLDYKLNPGYIAQDTYTMVVTYTISQD